MNIEHENHIRETIMVEGFPIEEFTFNVREFDINFMREFKDDIWWDEVFDWLGDDEEFIVFRYPELMEFWKEYDKSK